MPPISSSNSFGLKVEAAGPITSRSCPPCGAACGRRRSHLDPAWIGRACDPDARGTAGALAMSRAHPLALVAATACPPPDCRCNPAAAVPRVLVPALPGRGRCPGSKPDCWLLSHTTWCKALAQRDLGLRQLVSPEAELLETMVRQGLENQLGTATGMQRVLACRADGPACFSLHNGSAAGIFQQPARAEQPSSLWPQMEEAPLRQLPQAWFGPPARSMA